MLPELLSDMAREARARNLTDSEWAVAAGIRPETLCRVKQRGSCDAATLAALARGCGLELAVRRPSARGAESTGLFPSHLSRDLEERLLRLCAQADFDAGHWSALGPGFFMAGLANLVATANGLDPDGRYARLAESLHPGVRSPEAFRLWLAGSPVKPSRFLPMLRQFRRQRSAITA